VLAIARKMVRDSVEAEEVAQDVFVDLCGTAASAAVPKPSLSSQVYVTVLKEQSTPPF